MIGGNDEDVGRLRKRSKQAVHWSGERQRRGNELAQGVTGLGRKVEDGFKKRNCVYERVVAGLVLCWAWQPPVFASSAEQLWRTLFLL